MANHPFTAGATPCFQCIAPDYIDCHLRPQRYALTRELNKGGCAHHYMNHVTPNLASFVRGLKLPKGELICRAPRGWEAFIGTAFDHGLREKREPGYVDRVADAGLGLMELAGYDQEAQAIREMLERTADVDERSLYAACAVGFFRSGRGAEELAALQVAGDELKEALVTDLRQLTATADHHFNPVSPIYGPTFEGSAFIGGADADLIADGCLWDIKTGVRFNATADIRQSLAYALLDYTDAYRLDSIGIYMARYGVSWHIRFADIEQHAGMTIAEMRRNAPWYSPYARATNEFRVWAGYRQNLPQLADERGLAIIRDEWAEYPAIIQEAEIMIAARLDPTS